MANAKLTSIELERFKSYYQRTVIDLSPLTIILGRNNSGKSSIIQALLLLKQTLNLPRSEVSLHLEGMVDALSLREITSGWPAEVSEVSGPRITLKWSSSVDIKSALSAANNPDRGSINQHSKISSDILDSATQEFLTSLEVEYAEIGGKIILKTLKLSSSNFDGAVHGKIEFRWKDGQYACMWDTERAKSLSVEMDHFLPYLIIDRKKVGPRDRQRAWYNAFLILFAQPLDDLKKILSDFSYLGSMRTGPSSLYRPATVPPEGIGMSGEYAAQMLHKRSNDYVHYLPPLEIIGNVASIPKTVRARPFVDAVNDILRELGIDTPLRIDDVKDVGFRLLFGQSSMQHVGRGLSYILPVIALSLISDPLHFSSLTSDVTLEEYLKRSSTYAHCAFEEPEAHLHPKAQSKLAHWLIALAMSRRQMIVETHSDHLVRRLRGLSARAARDSDLERWILENVRILWVEQRDGKSSVNTSRLTSDGIIEKWPSDFMDEATDEERSIYHAALEKPEESVKLAVESQVIHDDGPEPYLDEDR